MPMQKRGLRVVLSPIADAGKALVMDSTHSELLQRLLAGFQRVRNEAPPFVGEQVERAEHDRVTTLIPPTAPRALPEAG
jgi:hypothetical protein